MDENDEARAKILERVGEMLKKNGEDKGMFLVITASVKHDETGVGLDWHVQPYINATYIDDAKAFVDIIFQAANELLQDVNRAQRTEQAES